MENGWTDFHEILRIGRPQYKEQSGKFEGVIFHFFSKKSMHISSITGKRMHGCSVKVGHETKNNLEHFRNVAINPLIPDRFFYFMGPRLLAISWENGWADFHEIFMVCQAREKNN